VPAVHQNARTVLVFWIRRLETTDYHRRRLVALIERPAVVQKILNHLGLPTTILVKAEETVCQVRGPPDELFPPDLDDLGNAAEAEPDIDEDRGFDCVDELPGDDLAA